MLRGSSRSSSMEPKERVKPRHTEHRGGSMVPQANQSRNAGILILIAFALMAGTMPAVAQGYAWYPSYYGGGYYRAPFYGGGLPYRGYNGYHMADRPMHRPPVYHYDWRAMRLPCRGCWSREW
jgi:hypothetical protein